jgi:hypothetical protein
MRLRTLILIAELIVAPFSALASSDTASGTGGLSARASIDFAVKVQKILQLRLSGQPATLEVTDDDVARGEIVVRGAHIHILANAPRGFLLNAQVFGPFAAVAIAGLSVPIEVRGGSTAVQMPSMLGKPRPPASVEYRLKLATNAQPGRYAWPVALALQEP